MSTPDVKSVEMSTPVQQTTTSTTTPSAISINFNNVGVPCGQQSPPPPPPPQPQPLQQVVWGTMPPIVIWGTQPSTTQPMSIYMPNMNREDDYRHLEQLQLRQFDPSPKSFHGMHKKQNTQYTGLSTNDGDDQDDVNGEEKIESNVKKNMTKVNDKLVFKKSQHNSSTESTGENTSSSTSSPKPLEEEKAVWYLKKKDRMEFLRGLFCTLYFKLAATLTLTFYSHNFDVTQPWILMVLGMSCVIIMIVYYMGHHETWNTYMQVAMTIFTVLTMSLLLSAVSSMFPDSSRLFLSSAMLSTAEIFTFAVYTIIQPWFGFSIIAAALYIIGITIAGLVLLVYQPYSSFFNEASMELLSPPTSMIDMTKILAFTLIFTMYILYGVNDVMHSHKKWQMLDASLRVFLPLIYVFIFLFRLIERLACSGTNPCGNLTTRGGLDTATDIL